MSYILRHKRLIVTVLVVVSIYLFIFINKPYLPLLRIDDVNQVQDSNNQQETSNDQQRLAVIVPFRDRFDELIIFVPFLSRFLNSQKNLGPYKIYIINQSSKYRFNRGALTNVGFSLVKDECDYIAIHDVDILPLNSQLSYLYPSRGPYHLTAPQYHPQYNYDRYFGGILLINNKHFELVNGMSNRYFGWGLEDDEFYTRVRAAKLPILRPSNLTSDKNNTFLHIHHKHRKRDTFKTKEQRDIIRRRDKTTGLSDLKYSLTSSHELTIDQEFSCKVFNVELYCDLKQTPWCSHDYYSHKLQESAVRESARVLKLGTTITPNENQRVGL